MAPYPEEYCQHATLYLCQFCLKYMNSSFLALRHKVELSGSSPSNHVLTPSLPIQLKCRMRHPPGDEIYRDNILSIFEVDGKKSKVYPHSCCAPALQTV